MSRVTPASLPSILLLLLFLVAQVTPQMEEQSILLRMKQYWGSPPAISHWLPSSNSTAHCSWPEVICTGGSVTGLQLVGKNITEPVPPFICSLTNLTVLELAQNYFPGEFPTSLYNCAKLVYLDLSMNNFVGPVPPDIDRLSSLQFLSLSSNNFSGDVPAAICRLRDLRRLLLHYNLFNGSFPPEIGDLSELEELGMAYNVRPLPFSLPSSFTKLQKLRIWYMAEANLIGEIPEKIGDMEALELLDLSRNSLTGGIPAGLLMLKNLSELYLFKNRLTGEIPRVITASNLTDIDLSENNLTGEIPQDIGKLQRLKNISLFSNKLSGEIPESIAQITTLTDVHLFTNNLSGILPVDFGRFSKLEAFEVASNNFSGQLPQHLCAGAKLVGLVAFENNLTGQLPESLGNCSSLQVVMIYNNRLSGKIPTGLWTALNLSTFMIQNNSFLGELPSSVAKGLSLLDISNNRLSGEIPNEVSSWTNLVVLRASNNLFNGRIPNGLTALPFVTTLLLDRNNLVGSIPANIISWASLTTLNLSRNQLSEAIPQGIGRLPRLSELDLSGNQLSGQIPPQIGLRTLTFLNLSSNHLTGEIPGEFENAAFSSSFLNNSGLCGSTSYVNLRSCNSANSPTRRSTDSGRISPALISAVVIAIFVLAAAFWLFVFRLRRKRKTVMQATWKITSYQKLNFTESTILSGLTENNAIGSGGSGKVYRVPVSHSGSFVAVKNIQNQQKLDHCLEKEFRSEVKVLSTIRHLNIVKLLCYISNGNSRLLVYEYLENRSLDRWLHKKNKPYLGSMQRALDWPARMNIAIGAAQGLCYMHHDCSLPIIHRDLKPSNILLDAKFNAKIADFGLAKILNFSKEAATMSSIAGSFGYLAPEYAQTGRADTKVDVYSFGVILLELTMGKEANYGDEHTSLAEWAWRHIRDGFLVADALDKEIKQIQYLNEMSNVFRLGVFCTSKLPPARPTMRQVLQFLLQDEELSAYGAKTVKSEHDEARLLKDLKPSRTQHGDSDNSV